MPTNPSDEPAAQATLLERLFALLHDCRAVVPARGGANQPRAGQRRARAASHYALVGVLEAGLVAPRRMR